MYTRLVVGNTSNTWLHRFVWTRVVVILSRFYTLCKQSLIWIQSRLQWIRIVSCKQGLWDSTSSSINLYSSISKSTTWIWLSSSWYWCLHTTVKEAEVLRMTVVHTQTYRSTIISSLFMQSIRHYTVETLMINVFPMQLFGNMCLENVTKIQSGYMSIGVLQ